MTSIDPTYYLKNQSSKNEMTADLGKDDFLKILVAQLQNQDPTSPMDDREFISQMASFSSLEQMMNMSKSIDTLVQSQMVSPVIQYSHMIGKTVEYKADDKVKSSEVISVTQEDGWAILELENGDHVYADGVIKVSDKPKSEGEESV